MCGGAAVSDLRSYRIPNWLTAGGALLGLATQVAIVVATEATWRGVLVPAALGGLSLLVLSGALGAAGLMGMGDVKLLAASGLCLRWPAALAAFLYTSLAGGVIALVLAIRRGHVADVARNLGRRDAHQAARSVHRMPYGLAIFAGVGWTVLARYVGALALV